MYAEVIVDVAAYPIDRPFDYLVPEQYRELIESGSRVKVPFGNRQVLGFVTALKSETDVPTDKQKPIGELLDIEPVLTQEMLEMTKWLKRHTLCYEIDALQVMLPSALRAKYEKILGIVDHNVDLPQSVQALFQQREHVELKVDESKELLSLIKKLVKEDILSLETSIKQKTAVKKVRMIHIESDLERLKTVYDSISNQAKKQKDVVKWMMDHPGERIVSADLLKQLSTTNAVLQAVIEKGAATLQMEEIYRDPYADRTMDKTTKLALTNEQHLALSEIIDSYDKQEAKTFLLHGITGSGKTEVYLQAIERALLDDLEAIVLVPEISLTPQMTNRFKERFGSLVAVLHSGLSTGEKYDEWRKIKRGEVKVVVGARSAIFAPFQNVGIIILDEEHEGTYKQDDSPRYHARDVAIWRSEYHNCPVILGSATPSLESYARAKKGNYTLLTLANRPKEQALPEVSVVDMREQLKNGNRSMFSLELAEAINVRLDKQEQMVLFLNRRGHSSFVLCRDCGTVVECPNCDISMTYHRHQEKIKCHYCGEESQVPHTCPECSSEHIRFFGTGTQKVEEEIARLFPAARVLRMDVDTTRKKGSHEHILKLFGEGKADILLGTQMIAKGLDFPNITLVGVLSADTTLHLADFRAAEKTFQLLTQVSGRAGRHDKAGEVIVQTYTPEHYAIQFAQHHDFVPFYNQEMMNRKQFLYPPFTYVVLIQITHEDVLMTAEYAHKAANWLRDNLTDQSEIIGPTASSISRLQNRYRYQCLIKYKKEPTLPEVLQQLTRMYRTDWMKKGILMSIDLNPSSIM
ncbi:primosomal protein N' [Paenisporosarcina quisquiliarum]|uniref:Replication restart protein PriA n=1 Tax=Paenisporosarcina quisquiliarum TaxID=365346 RepID=A0A9X3RBK0_9BACL|nr:primosomal protein N' [Paenisporosarcina quisquiliarum]MCZ8535589.1 primosomal protein N' [Paenisporosarcina quisquiliarum]